MLTRDITIQISDANLNGTITFFIRKANEFKSQVDVIHDNVRVNAKSLLGMISMGLHTGSQISITAEGPDAQEALDALCQLLGE